MSRALLPLMLIYTLAAGVDGRAPDHGNIPGCKTGDTTCLSNIPPNACSLGGLPPVEKFHIKDKELVSRVRAKVPTVFTDSEMVDSASNWSAEFAAKYGLRSQPNAKGKRQPVAFKTLTSHDLQFLYGISDKEESNPAKFEYTSPVNYTFMGFQEFSEALTDGTRDYHFYLQNKVAHTSNAAGRWIPST